VVPVSVQLQIISSQLELLSNEIISHNEQQQQRQIATQGMFAAAKKSKVRRKKKNKRLPIRQQYLLPPISTRRMF
jgi:hypothetical protein